MTDKETRTWWEYVDTGQHMIYDGWSRPSANDLVPTKDLDIDPSIDDICEQYSTGGDYYG